MSWDDFISDLANDALPAATKAENKKKYPCGQCAGTGKYQGARVHQDKAHCFACRGTGYFMSSKEDRDQAKAKRHQKKENELAAKIAAIRDAEPELFTELKDAYQNGTNNGFVASLANQLMTKGFLSENQINAWKRGKAKLALIIEAKKEAEKNAPKLDLGRIEALFATATGNGYKKPTYRAEGLVLSLAGETSVNAGAIYVKDVNGEYKGKVMGGIFRSVRGGEKAIEGLLEIAKDPMEAAVRYGRKTGTCSCCGRGLTNKQSIDMGIGPICAEKWGL